MENNTGKKAKKILKKIIFVLVGMLIMTQGVDLFIMTGVGIDPISVFVEGLSMKLGVSFGTAQTIVNIAILSIPLLFFRKYIGLTTLIAMFLMGPFFDLYLFLEGSLISPDLSIIMKIILVAVGQVLFSFGLAVYLTPDMGGSPCDTPSVIISKKFNIKYGTVRIFSDAIFLISGFILGGTVGLGTIIAVIFTGPISQVFRHYTYRFFTKVIPEE